MNQREEQSPSNDMPSESDDFSRIYADGPMLNFDVIASGKKVVYIRFGETIYTLKRTRNDRLILQK